MKKDMHVHSKYSSDCEMSVKDILVTAKKAGLDGVAITDHNTIQGGLEGLRLSKDYDIEVTVGTEISTNFGEVIGYHLTREVESREFEDVVDEIKRQGGVISIPHPFDFLRLDSIDSKKILMKYRDNIDYIEINARTLPIFNEKARKFALQEGFPLIGGSNAHYPWEIGRCHTIWDEGAKVVGNGSIKSLYPVLRTQLYKTLRI
ncbi:MAG: PHP domain-containing protein [Methanobacteriota archaeon]